MSLLSSENYVFVFINIFEGSNLISFCSTSPNVYCTNLYTDDSPVFQAIVYVHRLVSVLSSFFHYAVYLTFVCSKFLLA